ncbi:MAG: tyrosine-type recombinase/integrase [Deltaproteobacteria bacterium]|nr:tyrosine-type recombinase/integrase [Deltaproteobacteria bacterium]
MNTTAMFSGPLASQLHSFLEYKRAEGRDHAEAERYARHLDKVAGQLGATYVTYELAQAWAVDAAKRGPYAIARRAMFLRQLCRYLHKFDGRTYLLGPRAVPRCPAPRRPHVFTRQEIAALCNAAKLIKTDVAGSYYIWLLLLYTCGLRPKEGRVLTIPDVDLAEGLLRIRETKFQKNRLVPMSDPTLEAVREYAARRCAPSMLRDDDEYFIRFHPHRNDSHAQYFYFRKIIKAAQIGQHPGCRRPRPHDLRHSFAVHRLLGWYKDGGDVLQKLPLLSTYLGHASVIYTEHYLHITGEILAEADQRFHKRFGFILGGDHE